jgi:UDP:flavonoid glycosyltransferase YjiC (YdhE family)
VRILFASTRGPGHFRPLVPLMDACARAGHEVLAVGPPALAATLEHAGHPFRLGAAPEEHELDAVWSRVPSASAEEAERLVIGEIFARINVQAMLPGLRLAVYDWRPDLVVREPAEFASAIAGEDAGVPHVEVGIGLLSAREQISALSAEPLEGWSPGLAGRIARTPYLTAFPPSLDPPPEPSPRAIRRFRDPPAVGDPAGELPDRWEGDGRPLVYASFGTAVAEVPTAAPIYRVAVEALAEVPARALLTTGAEPDALGLPAAPPNVAIEGWVPQAAVLEHASAVVCHGGSGTTLGALASAVPLVITPLFADQPDNARAVERAGAGVVVAARDGATQRSDVDPAVLRDAILRVLGDDRYAAGAQAIADDIAAQPPADEVVAELAHLTA